MRGLIVERHEAGSDAFLGISFGDQGLRALRGIRPCIAAEGMGLLQRRMDRVRREPGPQGRAALETDIEIAFGGHDGGDAGGPGFEDRHRQALALRWQQEEFRRSHGALLVRPVLGPHEQNIAELAAQFGDPRLEAGDTVVPAAEDQQRAVAEAPPPLLVPAT